MRSIYITAKKLNDFTVFQNK